MRSMVFQNIIEVRDEKEHMPMSGGEDDEIGELLRYRS